MPKHGVKVALRKPKNIKQTLLRLWSYLNKYKILLFIVFILVIVNTLSTLLGSYMLRPLVNNYIEKGNLVGLAKGLVVMALIYLIGVIATYFQARVMIGISQKTIYDLRTDLFDKMQHLPVKYFDTNTHGDLMSRFTNDVDTVSDALNNTITQLFSGIISLSGTLILMLTISPILTILTLFIVPAMFFTAKAILGRSKSYFSAQQKAIGKVNGYIEEMVTGSKVVKVFNHEKDVEDEFDKLADDLCQKATKAQILSGMMMPAMQGLNTLNYALVAMVGGVLSISGILDIGGMLVFLQYSRQFGRPINEISNQFNTLLSALAGAERMFELMDVTPEPEDDNRAVELKNIKGDVRFNDVTFGYNEDKIILKNISLFAKPGQKIALVGSTGAGKTTITNLLTRFYDIQSGEITIDGIDIKDIKRNSLRNSMAMVLQDTHLFTGTVKENIKYGRLDATDEEVVAAATLAGADSFIRRLPHGYDTMLEGDGANLSQGQRQLLNIARAAIANPAILILDEATSSVDTRTERHIEHGMDRLMKDRTTFVIAHRLSTVRNSDAIMVIENGEIIERGNHDELMEQHGRYYRLCTGTLELD